MVALSGHSPTPFSHFSQKKTEGKGKFWPLQKLKRNTSFTYVNFIPVEKTEFTLRLSKMAGEVWEEDSEVDCYNTMLLTQA